MRTVREHLHGFGGNFALAIVERRCANWVDPISYDLCRAPLESDDKVYCDACEQAVSAKFPTYPIPRLPRASKCKKCDRTREWALSQLVAV